MSVREASQGRATLGHQPYYTPQSQSSNQYHLRCDFHYDVTYLPLEKNPHMRPPSSINQLMNEFD